MLEDFCFLLPLEAIVRCNLVKEINFTTFPVILRSYYPCHLTILTDLILDLLIKWILYLAVSNIERS